MSHLEHRHVMDQIFNRIFDTGSQEEKEQFIRWIEDADTPPEVAYRVPVTPFKLPKNWRKAASAIFTTDKPIDRPWADYYPQDKLAALRSYELASRSHPKKLDKDRERATSEELDRSRTRRSAELDLKCAGCYISDGTP
ncbi:hypothetical protein [Xanthomonas sp. BRIP62409]|uniref:hypothetical protein n=1 Tax=Xanthomonas sp. BRIP62409 TaxID=2182388 RepID=UPI000F8C6D69|nr:hypothetical protein [Xanthomonas sp. BRIP62409]